MPHQTWRVDIADQIAHNQRTSLYLANFQRGLNRIKFDAMVEITTRPANQYYRQINALKNDLTYAQEAGTTVILMIDDAKQRHDFASSLVDFKIPITETTEVLPNQVQIMSGALTTGFEWPQLHLTSIHATRIICTKRTKQHHVREDC